ncbi:hypothetical protein [Agromyces larvae]|uniref:Fe-S oxidoreductase n=1 Tax=Agromyces larvae TaxID=2929802 RepID=A0ABY4C0Y7_9MICO|nr:hypothetical protein [Agromyces larvae]UOE45158.1 hypothetical protein MTO99_05120 [Agromyces larvae]
MQLGTRWSFGAEPPASVPAAIRPAISAAEARRTDGAGRTWTLTWLEGRPIAELDDGTVVRDTVVDLDETDDDW